MEAAAPKENPAADKEKPSGCNFHLGYLGEKEHKQTIPDECFICKDLVECMHKK
jgi:hypothetical protein